MGKRKPTPRQEKFVEGILNNKSMRQAAIQAGYSVHTADNARQEILEKPRIQDLIRERLGGAAWLDEVQSQLWAILRTAPKAVDRLGAMDRWAKLTGAFAPQEHEITGKTPTERHARFREILALVEKGLPPGVEHAQEQPVGEHSGGGQASQSEQAPEASQVGESLD